MLLSSGQVKRMSELKVGDQVLVIDSKGGGFSAYFDTVYNFMHLERNKAANYMHIYHSGSSQPIAISDNHLIYRANDGEAVPASMIKPGDQLFFANVNTNQIQLVTVVHMVNNVAMTGVYAPLTFSGNIVVNQVLSSCYAQYGEIKSHKVAHAVMKPLRMKGKFMSARKECSMEYTKEGINGYCIILGKGVYPIYKLFTSVH